MRTAAATATPMGMGPKRHFAKIKNLLPAALIAKEMNRGTRREKKITIRRDQQ
jgi:hypothetical protein